MSVRILKPGLLTTIQDRGRFGAQKYGIIVSGPMDSYALRIANLLVGNDEAAAGLEMTIVGPEIEFEAPALLSVCGGDLSPSLNGNPVPLWRTIFAPEGSRLEFGELKKGCRAYLAVAGGFDVPVEMSSRSTYLRAGIGGWEGRPLQQGDRIPVGELPPRSLSLLRKLRRGAGKEDTAVSPWSLSADLLPAYAPDPVIRVIDGAERELFDEESVSRFFSETYRVLPQSDRMGYRISGGKLKLKEQAELISSPVTFGTIQVPADGDPIVLMADRQTTGGYPRIAQVISADLPLLAQVNLGGKVRFRSVSLKEAQQHAVIGERKVRTLRHGLVLQSVN
ncbi:biotin-dependent carboxyltransferase family protein [Paenibacillus humicola]|uniref:5-oxoprolinase subunit C family protein n=1 Tax=Paenibacillus humicola TaxID=3110540 RepID=UPI00237A77CD|nr:biotin-dependent carboxyltransferase family protein [Paenibacillus humicola]